jgi:uncharacterized protein
MDLHHPIFGEFPEYRDMIKRLRNTDDTFRKWFVEYHDVDDAIYRIEEDIDFASDQEIEEKKLRRAWLKDQIYRAVKKASAPAVVPVAARSVSARL